MGHRIENVREANVRKETRAPSKGPCSVFIGIRRLTSMMDLYKETVKLCTLAHGCEGKGVLKIGSVRGLGRYKTKSWCPADVVYGRHEARVCSPKLAQGTR